MRLKKPANILLTNDDGIDAAGIKALEQALHPLARTWSVAPDRERSACSQAISIRETLRLVRQDEYHFTVNGFPADCVNVALFSGRFPAFDLIVSGINHGPNLGDDVFYSGTVGAARHAVIHGRRAVAVSAPYRDSSGNFAEVARWVAAWIEAYFEKLSERVVYSINYPEEQLSSLTTKSMALGDPTLARFRWTRQGGRIYHDAYELLEEGGGSAILRLKESVMGRHDDPRSDFAALEAGLVSVTPLGCDTTDEAELAQWIRRT